MLCLTAGTAFAVTGFNLFGWHTDTTIVKSPREWQRLYHDATRRADAAPGRALAGPHAPARHRHVAHPAGRHRRRHLADGVGVLLGGRHPPRGTRPARRQAHAALDDLLAHHVVVAPPGSPENVAPPAGTKPPFAIFASDGGIQYTRKMYRDAANGHPATLIQSCRANGPVGTR